MSDQELDELRSRLALGEARLDELRASLSSSEREREAEVAQAVKEAVEAERSSCQDVVLRLLAAREEREGNYRRALLALKGIVLRVQRLGPVLFDEVMEAKEMIEDD